MPFVAAWIDAAITGGRDTLGQEVFDRAWQAGQALPLDAALAEATRELDAAAGSSSVTAPDPVGSGPPEGRQ